MLLKQTFVEECSSFLMAIAPQITKLIEKIQKELDYNGGVTLILPCPDALNRIPCTFVSPQERMLYSIKQFPRLEAIARSCLDTVTIINNQGSEQNGMFITLLKYEYLFERPLHYAILETAKRKFHTYI